MCLTSSHISEAMNQNKTESVAFEMNWCVDRSYVHKNINFSENGIYSETVS